MLRPSNPEYLEALHKSISHSDSAMLDTDTPEVREVRAEKELYIREHLDAVSGLSLYERLIFVRENLFDTNVRGDNPSDIRSTDLGGVERAFPGADFSQDAYPPFIKLVDTLDSFIRELPVDKQAEAAVRLASVVYGLGIPLHLFRDGNGQSLRLVALSYIHEYNPHLKDKYFPQRKTADDPQPITINYTNHVMDSVGALQGDSIFESSKVEIYLGTLLNNFKSQETQIQVLNLYKSYLETGVYSTDHIKNKWVKGVFGEALGMFNETVEDMKVKLDVKSPTYS